MPKISRTAKTLGYAKVSAHLNRLIRNPGLHERINAVVLEARLNGKSIGLIRKTVKAKTGVVLTNQAIHKRLQKIAQSQPSATRKQLLAQSNVTVNSVTMNKKDARIKQRVFNLRTKLHLPSTTIAKKLGVDTAAVNRVIESFIASETDKNVLKKLEKTLSSASLNLAYTMDKAFDLMVNKELTGEELARRIGTTPPNQVKYLNALYDSVKNPETKRKLMPRRFAREQIAARRKRNRK
ncbi:MAG: hypothetical protein Q7K42_03910 [Candidatus Diapherotrites archaeon]|nr:hypothetical protein [Candidatus Diapherotrites archaeon]